VSSAACAYAARRNKRTLLRTRRTREYRQRGATRTSARKNRRTEDMIWPLFDLRTLLAKERRQVWRAEYLNIIRHSTRIYVTQQVKTTGAIRMAGLNSRNCRHIGRGSLDNMP